MEFILFKNGFYIIGKAADILHFLKQKAISYKTVVEMLKMELN